MSSPEGLRDAFALVVAQAFRPAFAALMLVAVAPGVSPASAQTPAPVERVTFDEAIRRAVEKNPSAAIAAAGILRAEGLLLDARSASRLQINGNVTTTTLNTGVEFEGTTVTPRNQLTASGDIRMPLYAPARWARTAQAADTKLVAQANADEIRRQTALATADAYLTIIARRRDVDANVRARDLAKAHFDYAHELLERGAGSRLNELRAQQEVSTRRGAGRDRRGSRSIARRKRSACCSSPTDRSTRPTSRCSPCRPRSRAPGSRRLRSRQARGAPISSCSPPSSRRPSASSTTAARIGCRTSTSSFQPSSTYPSQFFMPQNSWRLVTQLTVPIFDSGQRQALKLERQAAVDESRAVYARAETQARSEVRAAREAIASAERGAGQRAGRRRSGAAGRRASSTSASAPARSTNIEVIDAEGRARDADTAVGIAEDNLRRARLELLTALGRFPA